MKTEWRPIESAPRDGTQVLLWAAGWRAPTTGWTYEDDPWQDCPFYSGLDQRFIPTHWMPLPEPPK
jgi:hypothetical protein